jgi:hypothetical protein
VAANVFGLRLLAQPRMQVAVLTLLALIVILFRALQFAAWTGQIQWGYDFSAYWAAAGHLIHGESPYQPHQLAGSYPPQQQYLYLYPPALAVAFVPLAWLFPTDYRAAAWVWTGLGAAILVASVLAISRVERLDERFPLLAGRRRWLLVGAALAFPPVVGELVLGNVHLLLLGFFTFAWLGIRRGDRAGDAWAGAAIAAATLVKLFPAVLVLWLLASGRFRAAGYAVVAGLVLVLVTLPVTGLDPWLQYPTVLANLSAPADPTDTLAPTVWLAPFLGFTLARLVVTAVGVVVVVIAARRVDDTARSFGVAIGASILIAPALYHHYLAIMVLPLLLGLSGGVGLAWLGVAYLLMWGGKQSALGDLAWLGNRALPTAGAIVLLTGLFRSGSGRTATPEIAGQPPGLNAHRIAVDGSTNRP